MFYYHNIWRFPDDLDWSHLHSFLETIGLRARMQLRHIQVLAPTGGVRRVFGQWPLSTLQVRDSPPTRMVRAPRPSKYLDSMTAVLDILRQIPKDQGSESSEYPRSDYTGALRC